MKADFKDVLKKYNVTNSNDVLGMIIKAVANIRTGGPAHNKRIAITTNIFK